MVKENSAKKESGSFLVRQRETLGKTGSHTSSIRARVETSLCSELYCSLVPRPNPIFQCRSKTRGTLCAGTPQLDLAHAQVCCTSHICTRYCATVINGAVHSKYTEEKSADEPESDRWVSVKPGLWTLDWTSLVNQTTPTAAFNSFWINTRREGLAYCLYRFESNAPGSWSGI